MQQVAPGDEPRHEPIEQNRERLAVARHDGRRPRARAQQPRRRRAARRRADGRSARRDRLGPRRASSRPGSSASRPSELVALQRQAVAHGAAVHARSTRSTPPTPRTTLLDRLEALGVAEAWRLAEPLAVAGRRRRRGSTGWRELAGPGNRGGARAGSRASLIARAPRRRAGRVDRAHVERSSAPSSPTPTWIAATLVEVDLHEGLETTLAVLGHKLKHTEIDARARVRPRAAAS